MSIHGKFTSNQGLRLFRTSNDDLSDANGKVRSSSLPATIGSDLNVGIVITRSNTDIVEGLRKARL